jgi:hypothetical protein
MEQQMFFEPYSHACQVFASAMGDWYLWGEETPKPGSPALMEWASAPNTMPWLTAGLEVADRHGLALFDAAFCAFEYVTAAGEQPKDYLVFVAGLRSCVEACAQSYWLLEPRLAPPERLTRLADMALADNHNERTASSSRAKGAGLGSKALRPPGLEADTLAIEATMQALLSTAPTREVNKAPRFGARTSITKQVINLFTDSNDNDEQGANRARGIYAQMSAPAHISPATIRALYEPALMLGHVGHRRVRPPHARVGEMLTNAGIALLNAHVAVALRFGWEVEPWLATALAPVQEVMRSPGTS